VISSVFRQGSEGSDFFFWMLLAIFKHISIQSQTVHWFK